MTQQSRLRHSLIIVVLFMLTTGIILGMIGGMVERTAVTVLGTAVLLALFGAYERVLEHNTALIRGLIAGGIIGLIVSGFGYLLGGNVTTLWDGTLFGLLRGIIVGGVVGGLTRAQPDEDDPWYTAIFLLIGSIFIGAVLGASVGLISGFVLGLVRWHSSGIWLAMVMGAVVGGYLGSYYQQARMVWLGLAIGAALTLLSSVVGGAVAGVTLGIVSGALAPMLLVGLIGGVGGLSSRGVKAMLEEAVEAPTEMLHQGAFTFLAPAVIVGIIVGTAASGPGGLIALPLCLATLGTLLAVFSEVDGRVTSNLTARSLVEMVILGADDLPIMSVPKKLMAGNGQTAVIGGLFGLLLGGASAGLGAWFIQQLLAQLQL
ncbi:MAG: hypothetical protein H6656_14940 [Ardenticatenaceae bacterium]|nr:hypothetical protein [Ardenticatenaceae bacterium]